MNLVLQTLEDIQIVPIASLARDWSQAERIFFILYIEIIFDYNVRYLPTSNSVFRNGIESAESDDQFTSRVSVYSMSPSLPLLW